MSAGESENFRTGDSPEIFHGDCREVLRTVAPRSVRTCVTSPPYFGLRDYGVDGQIGLEAAPDEYVAELVAVFRMVRDVLTDDGTLWLNLGDSYATDGGAGTQGSTGQRASRTFTAAGSSAKGVPAGLKPKDLIGIPWRVAFALQADGWFLRSEIIWHKPNPMPESVADRPTSAHETLFLLTKRQRYFYDAKAIAEPATGDHNRIGDTKNRRDVWTIPTTPFPQAHFAVMPEALVEPCVLAGSAVGDAVLDPFAGSGTVGVVALRHHRHFVGIEANPDYCELIDRRLSVVQPVLI